MKELKEDYICCLGLNMNNKYTSDLRALLCEFEEIKKWEDSNPTDSSKRLYFDNYLIVRSCGQIERIFKDIIYDSASQGSKTECKNYLTNTVLESSLNPSKDNICQLLNKFSKDWNRDFKTSIQNNYRLNQLDSLVSLRNGFSHGNINTSVSIMNIREYFISSIWIMNKLYNAVQ